MRSPFPAVALASYLIVGACIPVSGFAQTLESCGDAPQPIVRVKPKYPEAAVDQGVVSYVNVEFTVDEHGATREVAVIDSSDSLLEQAAIEAVRKWKYHPCAAGERIRELIKFNSSDLERELLEVGVR